MPEGNGGTFLLKNFEFWVKKWSESFTFRQFGGGGVWKQQKDIVRQEASHQSVWTHSVLQLTLTLEEWPGHDGLYEKRRWALKFQDSF